MEKSVRGVVRNTSCVYIKRPKRIVDRSMPRGVHYWYSGIMDVTKMGPIEAKAFRTWKNQISRCYHKSSISYKNYGAKGIGVDYLAREFVGWYLENYKEKEVFRHIEVGRINHSENYKFGNIEFVTKSDNSREMLSRTGNIPNRNRMVSVCAYKNGIFIGLFQSCAEAAKKLKLRHEAVSRSYRGIQSTTKGFTFRAG